jgi:hypothetical protein
MSTATAAVPSASRTSSALPLARVLLAALAGGVLSALLNALLYAVTHAAGVPFLGEYQTPGVVEPLPFPAVLIASVVPALPAALGFALLTRLLPRGGVRLFVAAAGVLTVLSFVGPLRLAGADAGTRWVLALMHPVTALAIVGALVRAARRAGA